jgi:glycerol-3-phosphate dehydrogenase (NAD(P)+)
MGDLMATCYSPLSRNRTAGQRVGRGEDWKEVVAATGSVTEGIATTKAVYEKSQAMGLNLQITAAMHDFLYGDLDQEKLVQRLMSVPVGTEMMIKGRGFKAGVNLSRGLS